MGSKGGPCLFFCAWDEKMLTFRGCCTSCAIVLPGLGVSLAAPPVYVPYVVIPHATPELIVEVVERKVSRDGRELALVLRPPNENFALQFEFTGTELHSLELLFRDIRPPKRLTYYFNMRKETPFMDLMDQSGVLIDQVGKDCRIKFDRHALQVLAPRGRIRYIAITADEEEMKLKQAALKQARLESASSR